MNRITILFVLVMSLYNTWNIKANNITIYGDIQEGFLKTQLQNAKVSILNADSTIIIEKLPLTEISNTGNRSGFSRYFAEVPPIKGTYLIRAMLDGYGEEWQKIEVNDPDKKEISVPTIYMFRKQNIELDEVTVKATRIKMLWRGDTIVYDATAFNLPDGSMLDNLIRQLPGAEIRDNGEIFVNGRKIDELLLGSRSFMRGKRKVLMENLPYYTVNKLKVYEKESDISRALGHDTGGKSYVMDINLKQDYQMGIVGNVEGAGGSERRYLGRAFLLSFTDLWRFTLLGNVNNVNETRHTGETGYWTPATMPQNMTTTRSVGAEADYISRGKDVKNNLSVDYTHLTTSTDMNRREETFLQALTPLSLTESRILNKSYKVDIHDSFTLLKPLYLTIEGDFKRERINGHTHSSISQWNDTLTARMLTSALDESTTTSTLITVNGMKSINPARQQDIGLSLMGMHYNNTIGKASQYKVTHSSVVSTTCNTNDILKRVNEFKVGSNYNQSLKQLWKLRSGINYNLRENKEHNFLYHPDTITLPSQLAALTAIVDATNSYRYRYTRHSETLSLTFVNSVLTQLIPGVNISSEQLTINLDIQLMQHKLDYLRGAIDTIATHNSFHINPSVSFKRKFGASNRNEIRAAASFTSHELDLLQTMPYRDDSKPLLVLLGNSTLKGRNTSAFSISFANHNGPYKQEISVGTHLDYSHRDVAQSVRYNDLTGVYTYCPINVSGSYIWNTTLDYSRYLDQRQLWSVQSNTSSVFSQSIDHTMLNNQTKSTLNRVITTTLRERAYIQFNKGSLNVRVTGDVKWRRSTGRMLDFRKLSAIDFQYGMYIRHTIPLLNTTLCADATIYSRRGYGSSILNTNDLMLNAYISQSLMKGKLVMRLDGLDLLHQLSQVRYEVNGQGQTETWYNSLPHYIMLHLIYQFNITSKK